MKCGYFEQKNQVKSHFMALAFNLQTDINQIFQMRYCPLLLVKKLQKYQRSKLEVGKKSPTQPVSYPMHSGPGCSGFFFDLKLWPLIFLQPLNLKGRNVDEKKSWVIIRNSEKLVHLFVGTSETKSNSFGKKEAYFGLSPDWKRTYPYPPPYGKSIDRYNKIY